MTKVITQFSTISALMSGLYDGEFAVGHVKKYGDFGLGCSHALAGELSILSQQFFESRGDGSVLLMPDSALLPFAQITTFTPEATWPVEGLTKAALTAFVSQHVTIDNQFLALKVIGTFGELVIRRPHAQKKPYKPVTDVANEQVVDQLKHINGTLMGFWTPESFDQLSVAGWHLHFVAEDKHTGGHVIDFALAQGELAYEQKRTLAVELPSSETYLEHDINMDDMRGTIKKVEN